MTDTFQTKEIKPLVGTEVNACKDDLLSGRFANEIRELLEPRGILVLRGVNMSDEEQLTFSRTLGELVVHGDQPIQQITLDESVSKTAEYLKGSLFWHIDGWYDVAPNKGAILGARRLPKTGGQTEFTNTHTAFEALPEDEKAEYEKLNVVHSMVAAQTVVYPLPTYQQYKGWKAFGKKVHPLVWTHKSGLKSLVLGSTCSHIEGMDYEEGRELLLKLLDWATQPQFVYTHEWQQGDLLIWDNTVTLHRVQPYDPAERLMHRTTLKGDEPITAAA